MAKNVEFDILARDRASKTFDHVGKSSDGLASKLGKFGGVAAAGLAGMAVAVAGVGVAAGVMGVKTAAANEQAEIAFTTMLGSGKKAQAFLKDLQAFAAKTPFEFPELQTAASSLISAGINAKKVIPIMTTLGDVTAGMGTGAEGVKRATIALQQMNAAGRITGEDLNQLRDAGIPVYDLLAKATGKSKAEVVKLAQAGKLGQKELGQMMKALESGKGLERFSGLMDKQSKSLSGLWATFKDTLNMGLAKAIGPLIPLLKDGLGKASEFLAQALPKVAAALQWVVKAAGGLYSLLVKGDFTKLFREAFHVEEDSKAVDILFRLRDGFIAVVGFIRSSVIPAIASFWGWIAGQLWPAIQKGYQTIMPGLKQALSILGGAFGTSGGDGKTFGQTLKDVGRVITDKVIPFIAQLMNVYLPVLATNIRTGIEAVKAMWKAFEVWRNVVKGVITFILRGFASVASGFATVLEALSHIPGFGWAKDAADKMRKAAGQASALADEINRIPRTVTVNTYFKTHGSPNPLSAKGSGAGVKGYAVGGVNIPRGWKVVGEQGPELMWTPGGDTVIPADQTRQIMAGKRSASGSTGGDQNVTVQLVLDGRVIQQSLLQLKRQGGVSLGLG